jgi:hypothetical protein
MLVVIHVDINLPVSFSFPILSSFWRLTDPDSALPVLVYEDGLFLVV